MHERNSEGPMAILILIALAVGVLAAANRIGDALDN